MNNVKSLAIENEKEVVITYPDVYKYITPDPTQFFTDGITKNLKIKYPRYIFDSNGYDYVDLGLSVYWAVCNIGATRRENSGYYYAYGGSANNNVLNYYWSDTDTLPISRDTARNLMGGEWRMPTREEYLELINGTTYSWTTVNGIKGGLFISKTNSLSIFFPANGWWINSDNYNSSTSGNYWTSTSVASSRQQMGSDSYYRDKSYDFTFNSNSASVSSTSVVQYGLYIRGVLDK